MRKLFVLLLIVLLTLPASLMAATSVEDLQKQIEKLVEEIDELNDRVDENESHAATDRIAFYGDMRTKADSLHFKDVTFNPGIMVDFTDFFNKVGAALNPAAPHPLGDLTVFTPDAASPLGMSYNSAVTPTTALDKMFSDMATNNPTLFNQLMGMMGNYMLLGQAPGVGAFPMGAKKSYDLDNDVLYTTRLRIGMKAKVYDNVDFAGRLLMYKNWGDSTGVQTFDSWRSYTMDGTNGGNTTGDALHVERAYFNWKNIGETPFYLSIGRRPSTYGPPSQYRENEQRGGTPSGHLVHFNFDGLTLGYKLSKLTGIEGQSVRFCYGQGFESEHGNGELFGETVTKDTHLGGFNIDVLNNGTHLLQMTLFQAKDVTDGFKGQIAFPTQLGAFFAPTMYRDMQKFPNFNFVTRVQPSTNIGDMDLVGLGYTYESGEGINLFASAGWTRLKPNGNAGMFGGMASDAVFQANLNTFGDEIIMSAVRTEEADNQDGYGVYVGVQIPAPMGKVGLEYNYGSKYWTPFTQAQDDMAGSKLATRGQVGEAYYIFDVNPKMFIKLGGIFYDYEYTNSGSPVGTPRKVEDIQNGTAYAMLPVVDEVWDANLSLTVKF